VTTVSTALIGLGNQGREHLAALLAAAGACRLDAVCDPRLTEDAFVKTLPGIPASCRRYHSVNVFLGDLLASGIRAVVVATPPSSYRDLLPRLFAAGLHVLVEKPLGMDLAEAAEHLIQARRHSVVLMPAVQRRFHAIYREVPDALRAMSGVEQALLKMEITHRPNGWRQHHAVGVLVDLGFHALDLARELFGDLRFHCGTLMDEQGYPCHNRFDAAASLLFLTESGTHLRVMVKRGAERKCEFFEAVGGGCQLRVDRGSLVLCSHGNMIRESRAEADWSGAMQSQLTGFAAACQSPGLPAVSAQAGLITMKLLEESYAHAATH
jgi:predicted dehydrogenase